MPKNPAGGGTDPPVPLPTAGGHFPAATAAADPPLDPPGVRSVSHGLRVVWKAEFSVDEPIANSSMFVLPMRTASASFSRRTMAASYGGTNFSRMQLPHVVGWPRMQTTSLRATGSPANR